METDVVFLCEQINARGFWLAPCLFLPSSSIVTIGIYEDDGTKLERILADMPPHLKVSHDGSG